MSMDKKLVADLTCSSLSGKRPSKYRHFGNVGGGEGNGRIGVFSEKNKFFYALMLGY